MIIQTKSGKTNYVKSGWLKLAVPCWVWKNPFNPFYDDGNDKKMLYWSLRTVDDTIREADKLFETGDYLEVYQLLNRIKFRENVDVLWRVSRSLYKMAQDETNSNNIKREMIDEAYEIITSTLSRGANNPNVHKWMALIVNFKTNLEGTTSKAKNLGVIKKHMKKAVELNPYDVFVLHMLGQLCYNLSNLNRFERFLASYLFENPPPSSYEEAYEYLSKAESIRPGFYIPNLYLLGKTCYRMQKYFRANYYLKMATSLPPRSSYEVQCAKRAKTLVQNLSEFDISRDALVTDI
ncbi:regulator of microtubule dynamics protein 1-like [Agrilus planipennis]|uniref:Regulator of microtubule dynamics protein 1 n=1 Tax=Agrilus planipennis TaxID=224129 RepID=A0A1W4XHL1_AGRPL|nr:regulator of microtubule dynamics protein 1-like [Agrilus planipennis]XP_025834685.1 regulator of microtubule dynamics protein 1-like [Agrilus planipennis]